MHGVDIEQTADASGYNICYFYASEWLGYTVNIAAPANYQIQFRVASAGPGGSFHLELDGSNITGPLAVPDTGGLQAWQTVSTAPISLPAGDHVFKLVADSNGPAGQLGNFDWINVLATAPAPALQFSSPTYMVPEGAQAALITVTRTGDSSSAVSVNYATADDSAIAGEDYTNTASTLDFAANQTSQTFSIPVIDDNSIEFPQLLTIVLSNPTNGATLGSPTSATLRIFDDDLFQPTPIDDHYYLRLNATDPSFVEVWYNSDPSQPSIAMIPLTYFPPVISTGDGMDSLVVDGVNGSPLPASGFTFDAGTGDDEFHFMTSIPADFAFQGGDGEDWIDVMGSQAVLPASSLSSIEFFSAGDNSQVALPDSISLPFTRITDQARVTLGPNAVLKTTNLHLRDGKIDLGNGSLVLTASNIATRDSIFPDIQDFIRTGRNKGNWNGPGIISSAIGSKPYTTLASAVNEKSPGSPLYTTFPKTNGIPVSISDILVKFTYGGDSNLDGVVNADDYFRVDSGFLSQKQGFYDGDFNYDDVVNADDYFLIDSAFIGQSAPLSQPDSLLPGPSAKRPQPPSLTAELFSTKPVL